MPLSRREVTAIHYGIAVLPGDGKAGGAARSAGLEPYAGRAVLNASAMFHGVVDEYLFRAHLSLGRPGATGWRHSAVSC
jgi:hypothetical protein